ncbi:cytochrome P450 [Mycena galopus ATCC 62051]|nr:cytochrome P450 [Mycena galopus ATCC 62051]
MDIRLVASGFLVTLILVYWNRRRSASKLRPIPGPLPHPFVGHTFQVPVIKTWKYFEQLAHQYVLGRRSRNYSSRKPLIYAGKYESNNLRLSLLPYGDVLKKQRAAFHQILQPRVVGGYEEMQLTESLRLLLDLVETPKDYYHHFQPFPASLVFTLTFGQKLDDDGKDLAAALIILTTFVQDINPNSHLVDTFPLLDLLPDFLSPWRAEAKRNTNEKSRMEKDTGMECFAARLWDQQAKLNISDEEVTLHVAHFAGSAFLAGTDSNSVTLLWFVMTMALYPSTMKRAQEEIDSIWNSDTFPNFSQMRELPYCSALVKEVIRWSPATPLSIPHYTDADDEYKGYTIRKGTSVISSLSVMHHNEEEFPNSTRKCPGQHMAVKTTWIAIFRVLWAFNIERRRDASGYPMKIDPEDCTSGLTIRPNEFPVNFVPRSAAHIQTIMSGQGRI